MDMVELQSNEKDLSVWPYTEVATGDDDPFFGPLSPCYRSSPGRIWRYELETDQWRAALPLTPYTRKSPSRIRPNNKERTMDNLFCGIDVSKLTLDVALGGCHSRYDNDAPGHDRLIASLPDNVVVVLEPTGPYHARLLSALALADVEVILAHPVRARRFMQSLGRGDKTDRVDAAMLAKFGRVVGGNRYAAPSPQRKQLRALHDRTRQLQTMRRAEISRLEGDPCAEIDRSVATVVAVIDQQTAAMWQQIAAIIAADDQLARQAELLQSIPGVANRTAVALLAELPDLRSFDSAKQLAAFVGLAPVVRQSGTSLHRAALPTAAKRKLRAALFLPALAAARHNPLIAPLRARLLNMGKPKMVVATACTHKLLRICYGVIKHDKPFQCQPA